MNAFETANWPTSPNGDWPRLATVGRGRIHWYGIGRAEANGLNPPQS
jgi:hypothetical protein